MRKIYYLSGCSTCTRIIRELKLDKSFGFQDIKTQKITPIQLDEMIKMAGSCEQLFSRTAIKYRSLALKEKSVTEKDYRQLILDEYTFLKRPVIIIDDKIFIGNSKNNIAAAKLMISGFAPPDTHY